MRLIQFIFLLFCVTSCLTLKQEKYIFPKEMLPHVQKDYQLMCEKGKRLYDMNCAKCHNTGKRKTIVPNFSKDQLVGYTLRTTNQQHETSIQDSTVTEEELVLIMYYLEYRKK